MLLLLLRLLTLPAPVLPAAPVVAAAPQPTAAVDGAALREAQANLMTIEAGPRKIRAMLPAAGDRAVFAGCVGQRLAEAQVHVALARDEMQRLTGPQSRPDQRSQARSRLALLAQRTRDVERAAFSCVDQDDSSISATRFKTDVPPLVQKRGDVTRPPPPPHPCPSGGACIVIPEP